MSFSKKDYIYDRLILNDDITLTNDSIKKKLKNAHLHDFHDNENSDIAEITNKKKEKKRFKYPSEITIKIFADLQKFASSQGLPFLDVCSPVDFAIFTSRYTDKAWEY